MVYIVCRLPTVFSIARFRFFELFHIINNLSHIFYEGEIVKMCAKIEREG